jgi:hypothetical protein
MTAAQRQTRRRAKLKKEEIERLHLEREGERRPFNVPWGYPKAKQQMIADGHEFERSRWFSEDEIRGVFVDGALLNCFIVIELAKLPLAERNAQIGEERQRTKDAVCEAVEHYMGRLRVSREELISYFKRDEA